MLIPYRYLVPLLIFTLLIGVVIGDRLAAEAQWNGSVNGDSRSGSCGGLASARLHACVHHQGSWRSPQERARTGGVSACGYEGSDREKDN